MRAALPDLEGTVVREGAAIGYEAFGSGEPAVLLMPAWTIVHSRFWKLQVPYLARRFRVVTFDGPGNGRSDRPTDPARYSADAHAADAAAVLDACEVERAVVVGLSLGALYGVRFASLHPERVRGLVLVGPAIALAPPLPERAAIGREMYGPAPTEPQGWDRYNVAYWYARYDEWTSWFFHQVLSEPHSTKAHDDAMSWAAQTGPEVLEAESHSPPPDPPVADLVAGVHCPVMVVQGTDDRLVPVEVARRAAELTGGALHCFEGSGHMPNLRDPVRFNLLLRQFVEGVWR